MSCPPCPDSPEQYLAVRLYGQLIRCCEQAIALHPDQYRNYWYLGLAHLLQGDLDTAQAVWFSAVTRAEPEQLDEAIAELVSLLDQECQRQLQQGRPDLAEQICLQTLELNPNPAAAYSQLGHLVSLQGRLDEALDYWQTAIELNPESVEAYCYQGEVYQKLAAWGQAIAAYTQALQLQPTWKTHYQLGFCLGQQQRWQEAQVHFEQALQLQPELAFVYGDRGWAWLQQGKWEQAFADFQVAVQQRSTYAQDYIAWVDTLAASVNSPAVVRNAKLLSAISQPNLQETAIAWNKFLHQGAEQQALQQSVSADTSPLPKCSVAPPIAVYEMTQDWANQGSTCCYTALHPPSKIELYPPKTIDRAIHFSFRFEHQLQLPGTFVATIPKGRFWLNPAQTSSAILTAENQLLGDLSPEFPLLSPGHPDKHSQNHSVLQNQKLPGSKWVNGTIAVLSGLTNDMYFHWMFDVLPRIHLLAKSNISWSAIDGFLVSHHLPFQQETLAQLEIPTDKILATEDHLHIQANRLIVPSYPGSPAWMPKWSCDWLRETFLGQGLSCGGDRLYITRQQTGNRRVVNESDVIHCLQKLGFESVALESLSVAEQVALLSGASVVVSPHGGGLTNTVFCQPGTKVIEIFSPNYVYPCYWLISNLVGLNYYYLTGKTPEGAYLHQLLYPDPRVADIWVDIDELKAVLKYAEVN
ncbi:MAG: hypothetical protein Kow00121_33810 [Elainellaceae cyanobacterium]